MEEEEERPEDTYKFFSIKERHKQWIKYLSDKELERNTVSLPELGMSDYLEALSLK